MRTISILFLLFLSCQLFSQSLPAFIPYREGKKWGYCDSTGKILIQPQWESASLFKGDCAIVSTNNKFGLIDKAGKILIEPQYGYLEFEKNYFVAQGDTKYSHINKNNERVDDFDDPVYEKINTQIKRRYGKETRNVLRLYKDYYQASYDSSFVRNEQMGYHHYQSSVTEPLYFLCNQKGEKLSKPAFGSLRMLCPTAYYAGNMSENHVIMLNGQTFNKVKGMSNVEQGVYRFQNNNQWYILDSAKCQLISLGTAYTELGPFKNKYAHAHVRATEKYESVLVDLSGKSFTKSYHFIGDFSEGLCVFQNHDGKYGFIDEKGNESIVPVFTHAFNFKEGLALVEQNGDYFYIDKTGQKALDINSTFDRSITKADRAGRSNISDGDFYGFSNGLAIFEKDGKYGYINKKGEEVLPAVYAYAEPFLNGLAIVYEPAQNSKDQYSYSVIDSDGKKVHTFEYLYEATTICSYAFGFNNPVTYHTSQWRAFYDRNNWLVFNKKGQKITNQMITSLYYENINNGKLIKVYLMGNPGTIGYISSTGMEFFKN